MAGYDEGRDPRQNPFVPIPKYSTEVSVYNVVANPLFTCTIEHAKWHLNQENIFQRKSVCDSNPGDLKEKGENSLLTPMTKPPYQTNWHRKPSNIKTQ